MTQFERRSNAELRTAFFARQVVNVAIRRSGILAHPTSFPSPYGVGDLGCGAFDFLNFVKNSGCTLWQLLPLGYTGFGDSPYQCFSAFAGNPLIISPDLLLEDGLLSLSDLKPYSGNLSKVDYGFVFEHKNALLKKAYQNFKKIKQLVAVKIPENKRSSGAKPQNQKTDVFLPDAYKQFREENASWLDDFAMFMALKNHFIKLRSRGPLSDYKAYAAENKSFLNASQIDDYYYGGVFNSWPKDIATRQKQALARYKALLSEETDRFAFVQFIFFRQWAALKDYAGKLGIQIIGDIPIFSAMDSSDAWADPNLFCLDENLQPTFVAGVPPDYFSETGQLWGNPLYNWAHHKETGFEWWKKRIGATLNLVDILRIDHFRGFASYWKIKYGMPNAVKGVWAKGPGAALFNELNKEFPHIPIIAEDLGVITPDVVQLREKFKLPGMKILQFAFGDTAQNAYLPHNITDSNTVLYTGTHDNDTAIGWYDTAGEYARDHFRRYLNTSGDNVAWDMIRLAYASTADTVIIPVWDILSLNCDHRMNTPGQKSGNWQFRYMGNMLNDELAARLSYLSALFGR